MPAFTVLSESGRRVTVRPTPSDTLQSVVAAACAQLPNSRSPEAYALLHKTTVLTLSTPVRLANLPQGATLELKLAAASSKTAASSPVKVALQIVGGGRVIGDFGAAATLWDVLTAAEARSNGTLNLTARYVQHEKPVAERMVRGMSGFLKDLYAAGSGQDSSRSQTPTSLPPAENQVVYQQPVAVLLNKEYATNEALQATTLRSLGFTGGSVMIRLSFKDTPAGIADLFRVASAASSAPGSPVTPTVQPPLTMLADAMPTENTERSTGQVPGSSPSTQPAEKPAAEPTAAAAGPSATASACTAHKVRVFDAPPSDAAPARIELPESFYESSNDDDAKLLISAQCARQTEAERGFKSRQAQEAESLKRRDDFARRHPQTTIRFRFPDQVQIQATFASGARVAALYDFVAQQLSSPRLLRALFLQPPVQDLEGSRAQSLLAARLTPAAVVHVRLADNAGLKPSTLALLRDSTSALAEPLELPPTDNAQASPPPPPMPSSSPSPSAAASASARSADKPTASKMPKWFLAGQRRS
ncbi:hypothetical protein LPJ70_001375 [Coemansia sp. RSA 2708]|nr:hypothetical protein LPJ70_001375 [Coemansia sp. RSA 2708]